MIKNENYYTKHGWMINQLQLEGKELEVYAIIYSFSQTENQMFTASIQYITEWVGCSRRTVERILKKLVNQKYIFKRETKKGVPNFYFANLNLVGTCDMVSHDMRHGVVGTCDMVSHNNKYNNKNNNIKKKNSTEQYQSFPQNEYDFEKLEQELLEAQEIENNKKGE